MLVMLTMLLMFISTSMLLCPILSSFVIARYNVARPASITSEGGNSEKGEPREAGWQTN